MIDQKRLMQIIDRFVESRLTKMILESEDFKLVLESDSTVQKGILVDLADAQQSANPVADALATSADSTGQDAASTPNQSADQSAESALEVITSPIVGTFYRSPAPDAPPFVDSGSKVDAGASLCIIEAMKMMNKLEADFNCEIVNILVEGGTMIEYGTPLFEVRRL